MSLDHAVIWIDHKEAHVIHFDADDSDNDVIRTRSTHPHLHYPSGSTGSGHSGADQPHLHAVTEAVADAREILVVGPGSAKLELIRHAEKHDPKVSAKILGVETVDHPTDRQLLAHARAYFLRVDKMNGTAVIHAHIR